MGYKRKMSCFPYITPNSVKYFKRTEPVNTRRLRSRDRYMPKL